MAEIQSNLVDLTVVYSKLNAQLDENISRLNAGAVAVENYNKKITNVPSQFQKALVDIKQKTDAVATSNKDLTAVEKERLRIEKELEKTNAKLATSSDKNTQALTQQKTALKVLNSAYLELSQKEAESARRVQDLIARGKTATQTQSQYNRELRNAQREFTTYRTKVLQADQAVGRWNRTGERSIGFMRNLAGAFGLVGGVTLFASITREVFQTTKELQSLDNALMQVSGTQEQMARSQSFLRDISQAYGLEINGLTKQFTQFYVSAKDKISATEIENIFRSVSKAGATMGLSVENQERAFLALNQMMSKGVVSAEELRGQLGEALPGAFGIMAKAVGVTEQELGKLMKDGKLLADDVLPKFARELEKVYGIETIQRVETLTASQNRLANSWTEFVRSLNESETGGISQFFKFIVDGLNDIANLLIRVNTSWNDLYKQAGKKGAQAGKQFFEENIRLNSSDVELSEKERTSIRKRISDIKEEIRSGYNDPKLQKELNELYRKLNPSSSQAESLGNLATEKIDEYSKKISKLNEKLKEVESNRVGNAIKGVLGFNQGKTDLKKKIEEAEFDLAYWKQVSESADNYGKVVEKVDKKTQNYNTTKKASVKIQKEEEQLIFGTEAWLEKQIALLTETRRKTERTSEGYKEIGGGIAYYQKWLETLTGSQKKSNEESEKTEKILKYGTIPFYDDLIKKTRELQDLATSNQEWAKLESLIKIYQDLIDEIRGVSEATKELEKANTEYFDSFISTFQNESGFSKFFELIQDDFKLLKEGGATTALAISEAFQEAFNTISESSQANFDREYERLAMQKEIALKFAGESSTAREEIERQAEEKRKAIARREAEAQKRLAIFNIAVNTAQAIIATYAKLGFTPAGIASAIGMGVIGAAQIAIVQSQQIPQFWKGTDNAPEGYAWTQEKGAEVITDKNGKVKTLGNNKGAQLTYLNKGDKVLNAEKSRDYINKTLINAGIQPMRSTIDNLQQNNSLTTDDFNAGISKLAKTMQSNKGSETNVYLNNRKINTDYFKGKAV